jgi:hypothetical protein
MPAVTLYVVGNPARAGIRILLQADGAPRPPSRAEGWLGLYAFDFLPTVVL